MPSSPATGRQQRGNFMPLVHQARRTIRNRQDGNGFATDETIRREIEDLSTAYLATSNPRVSRALRVSSWTCSKP